MQQRKTKSRLKKNERIRILLEQQKGQILADFRPEIHKHEFQADSERRIQELSGFIESQRGEINRALAGDEQLRRDQQLLHVQLLDQKGELLREAHEKSLNGMQELKRFQVSTFDTIARINLVEDRDTILELTGKIQELQNEVNCMNDSRDLKMLNQYAVDNPTLPVNQCHSHLIQFLVEC